MVDDKRARDTQCTVAWAYRVFWPGAQPSLFCDKHTEAAMRAAGAIGLSIYVEPIPFVAGEEVERCQAHLNRQQFKDRSTAGSVTPTSQPPRS